MTSSPSGPGSARVVALAVASDHRAPMEPRPEILVEAGLGVVGDRFHGSLHRHVSVQSVADLAAAAAELGRGVDPLATRRTVTVDGIEVPTEPGARLRLGDVVLEVVRLAAPCRRMDESLGPGGRSALRRRGGAVLRAVAGGVVRVGDPVVREDAPAHPGGSRSASVAGSSAPS